MAKSGAERMREFRARNRENNIKELLVLLPIEYKNKFDTIRYQLDASITDTMCKLIDNFIIK